MSILAFVAGENYWYDPANPFYLRNIRDWSRPRKISWKWRYQTEPGMGNLALWQPFGYWKRPEKGKSVTIRARVSDLIEFVKTTHMFKQMQRLHFMFRPPENSSDRPPIKVKTWAGEEDETDMILRGPQEGDHFLPERPYRPWPEEVVRDFKADGVYWNIRIS
ncbi:hypothetical protein B0T18DRAFT_427767 [Schizothecium vesticola]|uniref:Uncharacterized protein n=1 Tax=Schizothecium vesticola TaxID=314040 RepID=A0AA40K8A2_9PEZI|nr:hypothetical protein B0T18DRAFT_427767 [Schizothecium vesticola]